jgi:hypothetical protein
MTVLSQLTSMWERTEGSIDWLLLCGAVCGAGLTEQSIAICSFFVCVFLSSMLAMLLVHTALKYHNLHNVKKIVRTHVKNSSLIA